MGDDTAAKRTSGRQLTGAGPRRFCHDQHAAEQGQALRLALIRLNSLSPTPLTETTDC